MLLTAPALLTMFRAGLRVVSAADRAAAQKLRDDDVVFPRNPGVPFNPGNLGVDEIRQEVTQDDRLRAFIAAQGLTEQFQALMDAPTAPAMPPELGF